MATDQPKYSTEQLLEGIRRAVEARDFDAVAAILRLLAVQDPHAAQAVLDTVSMAAAVRADFEYSMAAAHRAVNASGEEVAALRTAATSLAGETEAL